MHCLSLLLSARIFKSRLKIVDILMFAVLLCVPPKGAGGTLIVRLSDCPSVCPSVPSLRLFRSGKAV